MCDSMTKGGRFEKWNAVAHESSTRTFGGALMHGMDSGFDRFVDPGMLY